MANKLNKNKKNVLDFSAGNFSEETIWKPIKGKFNFVFLRKTELKFLPLNKRQNITCAKGDRLLIEFVGKVTHVFLGVTMPSFTFFKVSFFSKDIYGKDVVISFSGKTRNGLLTTEVLNLMNYANNNRNKNLKKISDVYEN